MAEDTKTEEKVSGLEETFKVLTEEMMRQKNSFGFETALVALKDGFRVYRYGWNGRNMWIKMQKPTTKSMMTLPYIFMKTAGNDLVPWLASQTDLLSEDWEIVK
jgi:hypothetical protein